MTTTTTTADLVFNSTEMDVCFINLQRNERSTLNDCRVTTIDDFHYLFIFQDKYNDVQIYKGSIKSTGKYPYRVLWIKTMDSELTWDYDEVILSEKMTKMKYTLLT